MKPWGETRVHEPHSADDSAFILKWCDHEWEVWFDSRFKSQHDTRKKARKAIRSLKRYGGQYPSRYNILMEDGP